MEIGEYPTYEEFLVIKQEQMSSLQSIEYVFDLEADNLLDDVTQSTVLS